MVIIINTPVFLSMIFLHIIQPLVLFNVSPLDLERVCRSKLRLIRPTEL